MTTKTKSVSIGNLQQISADGPTESAGISVRVCGDSDCGMVEDSNSRLAQGYLEGTEASFGESYQVHDWAIVGSLYDYISGVDLICATHPTSYQYYSPNIELTTDDIGSFNGLWTQTNGIFFH